MNALEQKNYVRRCQGAGTYVVDRREQEKGYVIAMAVPAEGCQPFYMTLAGKIEPKLRKFGHQVHLFLVEDSSALLEAMKNKQVKPDAVIVCGFLVNHYELILAGVPCIIAGGEGYQNADNVVFDTRAGAFSAVSHLIKMGHRRILFLSNLDKDCKLAIRINPEFVFEMCPRYQGYCDALNVAKIPLDRSLVLLEGESKRNSYRAVKKMVSKKDFDFTAIFASTDRLAEGAIVAMKESGIVIPEQVSVIGCDNLTEERDMLMPLTSLDLRLEDMADAVIKFLLERIKLPSGHEEYRSLALIPKLVRCDATVKNIK